MPDSTILGLDEQSTLNTDTWFPSVDDTEVLDANKNKRVSWPTIDAAIDAIIAAASQPLNANLTDISALTPTKGNVIVGNGSDWISVGIGSNGQVLTANSVQASGLEWAAATGGLSNVVEDTTPQLGGNLDVNSNSIVSVSNGDIAITPNGTGSIVLDGLSWPQSDGSANQVLETDGAGQLSWVAQSGGGGSSLPVADTTSIVEGSADATKELRIEVDGLTTATTRVWTAQDADLTVAGLNIAQTFSATQTFTSRVSSTLNSSDSEIYGLNAGNASMTGSRNVILGNAAGSSWTSANNCVVVGDDAGLSLTSGSQNVLIGYQAGRLLVSGTSNVFIGREAGEENTSSESVIVGAEAGQNSTGGTNVFVGFRAGEKTTGDNNVFVGSRVGALNTSGQNNVFIGYLAGSSSLTATNLVLIGNQAGENNISGTRCTAIGNNAMNSNVSSEGNTAYGNNALRDTTGGFNVGVGPDGGRHISTGASNVAIGADSGPASGDGAHDATIAIGRDALITDSNQMVLGSSAYNIQDIRFPGTTRPVIREEDSGTNAILNIIGIGHNSTGTPAAGFGAAINVQLDSSTTANQSAGAIAWEWGTATHASRAAKGHVSAYYTSTERKPMQFEANSSGSLIGFLDTTPAAQQAHIADPSGGSTIDTEARTAINSILAVIETFGFVATS